MKKLIASKTMSPDFSGFMFFVEAGRFFEISDFCDAYGLDADDFDQQEIKGVQHEAGKLCEGEWLEVAYH
jgi:hypothetical protein